MATLLNRSRHTQARFADLFENSLRLIYCLCTSADRSLPQPVFLFLFSPTNVFHCSPWRARYIFLNKNRLHPGWLSFSNSKSLQEYSLPQPDTSCGSNFLQFSSFFRCPSTQGAHLTPPKHRSKLFFSSDSPSIPLILSWPMSFSVTNSLVWTFPLIWTLPLPSTSYARRE